jgi:hypothetical protein
MSSARLCCARARHLQRMLACVAVIMVALAGSPALGAVSGPPASPSGQARFEVVPLGSDDQTAKFSTTLDGKLLWETNSIGSGGFGGWPTLGAPSIVSDTGPRTTFPCNRSHPGVAVGKKLVFAPRVKSATP